MNARTKWMALVVVGGLLVAARAAVPASADSQTVTDAQYREAMWSLVPVLGRYSGELSKAVSVAAIKPEQVCQSTLPELAARGNNIVQDLAGTTPAADMAETHVQLLGTVQEMTAIAAHACENPSGYAEGMAFETARLNRQRQTLLAWMLSSVEPIRESVQPVTGQ